MLKLIGRSSCLVPQVLLLLEPMTNLRVPPLVNSACDIQFLVYACPFSVADWMYMFAALSPDAMMVATAPVASLRMLTWGK